MVVTVLVCAIWTFQIRYLLISPTMVIINDRCCWDDKWLNVMFGDVQ